MIRNSDINKDNRLPGSNSNSTTNNSSSNNKPSRNLNNHHNHNHNQDTGKPNHLFRIIMLFLMLPKIRIILPLIIMTLPCRDYHQDMLMTSFHHRPIFICHKIGPILARG